MAYLSSLTVNDSERQWNTVFGGAYGIDALQSAAEYDSKELSLVFWEEVRGDGIPVLICFLVP